MRELDGAAGTELAWLHGGDLAARQLAAEGVRHLFTLTGGHISAVYDGARFVDIRLVDFRHEQAAVHAADAYARLTRRPAAAAVTAGPGVTGALTAVANAYYAHSPVVVLGGRNPFLTDGAGNLQEAPHLELMRPVTKSAQAAYDAWRVPDVVRDAFALAASPRFGPAFVDLPMDVQLTRFAPEDAPAIRRSAVPTAAEPDDEAVRRVADALGRASAPVVFVGSGAYWAGAGKALAALLAAARCPVYCNGMARGLLGARNPYQLHHRRREVLAGADLVLVLGADFDFRLGFGAAGSLAAGATIVQVDPQASALGRNRDVALAVCADIERFLRALLRYEGRFGRTDEPERSEALRRRDADGEARMRVLVGADAPIHPLRLAQELAGYLDPDAVVIGDGGDVVTQGASVLRPGGPGCWMDPGPFGCLGIGAPFAMGARLARPDAQIAVLFGDGAFGFNGFEYEAAVRQKLPFVGVMGNDGAWGEMRTFHEDIFGPEHVEAQYLSRETAYETVVRGLGGYGERVERASEIRPALRRAFDSGVPALLNVLVDPAVRREEMTISGKQVARAYGGGDPHAFRR